MPSPGDGTIFGAGAVETGAVAVVGSGFWAGSGVTGAGFEVGSGATGVAGADSGAIVEIEIGSPAPEAEAGVGVTGAVAGSVAGALAFIALVLA